ncbi:glycoside hydrolase family 127 protein, partial [bacterium]
MAMSRRVFLQGLSAAGMATLTTPTFGWSGWKTAESHALTPVPIENVVIDDAFWTPKRDVWRSVTLWDCFRKFEEQGSGVMNNFDRVRDGLTGGNAGFPWHDGLIYEMIRAASDFLRSQLDPELEAKLDGYVTRIVAAAAKDPGGYVNTYTQIQEPNHRWGLNGGLEVWQHEFYNLGALVDAGVHHYRATGKTTLLEAGVRIANTISNLVGPEPGRNLVPSHELPEEAMLGLYELLKERPELAAKLPDANPARYLALAEFWIENRRRHAGKPDWEKDRGKAEEAVRKYEDYAQGRPSW